MQHLLLKLTINKTYSLIKCIYSFPIVTLWKLCRFGVEQNYFQSKYSVYQQLLKEHWRITLSLKQTTHYEHFVLLQRKEKNIKQNVHILDRSPSVSCLSQIVSFTGPLNDIDISVWLCRPRSLGICFQPYCTGLSANGCCSPAWPANSSLLIRSYWWDVVLPPPLMASHKDEPRGGWYNTGLFLSLFSLALMCFFLSYISHSFSSLLTPFPSLFLLLFYPHVFFIHGSLSSFHYVFLFLFFVFPIHCLCILLLSFLLPPLHTLPLPPF